MSDIKRAVVATAMVMLSDLEVADMLGLSVSTLRRWRCEGRGQGPAYVKMGGRVSYLLEDVQLYVMQNRRNVGP